MWRITFPTFEADRSKLKFDTTFDPKRLPYFYVCPNRPVWKITLPKFEPDQSKLKFDTTSDLE